MANENMAVRLRRQGLDVGSSTGLVVDPGEIYIPGPEHPLFDERSLDPVDEVMARDIFEGSFRPTVGVREDGIDSKTGLPRLTMIWGNSRTKASIRAREMQVEAGVKPDRLFRIGIQHLRGDDRAMMMAKIAENGARREETPRTLAAKFKALVVLGGTLAEGANLYRINRNIAEFVVRYDELSTRLREAFERRQLPIDVLPYFFTFVPEEREGLLDKIEAAGVTAPEAVEAVARQEKNKIKRKARQTRKARGEAVRPKAMAAKVAHRVVSSLKEDGNEEAQLACAVMRWERGESEELRKLDARLFAKLEAARGGKKNPASEDLVADENDVEPGSGGVEPVSEGGRARVASALANGRSKHLPEKDLVIARAIAAYERYMEGGEVGALDYLPNIKAIVDEVR